MATSKFVSGGTIDEPKERDDEWKKAHEELERNRRLKEEEGLQQGGKSLYETLQANKAAKQEAFEESIRLKNQFRSLDEDEAEFLDSVLESTRAKEAALRKETTEQLDLFRRQQEQAQKAIVADENGADLEGSEEQWNTVGRKRKKGKEKDSIRAFKLRKSASASEHDISAAESVLENTVQPTEQKSPPLEPAATVESNTSHSMPPKESALCKSKPVPTSLGLDSYLSDDDET